MRMLFFFFNDTATTEIYTLSLHDALPISLARYSPTYVCDLYMHLPLLFLLLYIHIVFLISVLYLSLSFHILLDRKSTRLNSSHANISYAVFCLKKNKHIS